MVDRVERVTGDEAIQPFRRLAARKDPLGISSGAATARPCESPTQEFEDKVIVSSPRQRRALSQRGAFEGLF